MLIPDRRPPQIDRWDTIRHLNNWAANLIHPERRQALQSVSFSPPDYLAHDRRILDNTIHDPDSRLGRLIRLVHDNGGLLVAHNLLSGPPLRNESPSRI